MLARAALQTASFPPAGLPVSPHSLCCFFQVLLHRPSPACCTQLGSSRRFPRNEGMWGSTGNIRPARPSSRCRWVQVWPCTGASWHRSLTSTPVPLHQGVPGTLGCSCSTGRGLLQAVPAPGALLGTGWFTRGCGRTSHRPQGSGHVAGMPGGVPTVRHGLAWWGRGLVGWACDGAELRAHPATTHPGHRPHPAASPLGHDPPWP